MFDAFFANKSKPLQLKPLPDGVVALGTPTPVTAQPLASAVREAVERAAAAGSGSGVRKPRKLRAGDWRLEVHVIRCASLFPRDQSGTSDPFVEVTWLGQAKKTATRSQNNDPVFDEHLSFAAKNVSISELNQVLRSLPARRRHIARASGDQEIDRP